jgi:hypothetical protein
MAQEINPNDFVRPMDNLSKNTSLPATVRAKLENFLLESLKKTIFVSMYAAKIG